MDKTSLKTSVKKSVITCASLSAVLLMCSSCGLFSDPYEPASEPAPSNANFGEVSYTPTLTPEESAGYEEFGYHPVYDFKGTGNFTDIKDGLWETGGYDPHEFVGKWYEDGFTNGYYIELYGDGTWQLFADTILKGYYDVWENGIVDFTEGGYGVPFGQGYIYESEDFGENIIALTLFGESMVNFRTPESPIKFVSTRRSSECDDLDSYYRTEYPFMDYQGTWYPLGETEAQNFYEILGSGNWAQEKGGQGMLEVGILEDIGGGKFTSVGANFGEEYLFEYPGDGYMYINGEPYELEEGEDKRYKYIVDTFLYYDDENDTYTDRGYEFFEDRTFNSLPGNEKEEHGIYFFLDDNLLLYDENGYRLHLFSQDIFIARAKTMYDDNDIRLKGQGPDPILEEMGFSFVDEE